MLSLLLQTTEVLDNIKTEYGILGYIIGILVVSIIFFLVTENRILRKTEKEVEEYRRKRDIDEVIALSDLTSIIDKLSSEIKDQPKILRDGISDIRRDVNSLEMRVNERINVLHKDK